ncbi:MAG: lysophospholipid acyltransferase family protein [Myxococcales bacterium]|nr:lysophospholipid acyltransferase family protein [Myxococcales bacterium]
MASWLVRLFGRVACALSARGAERLGRLLGLVWFHLVRIRRPTVLRQLRAAFPSWPARRVRSVARELYGNLGRWAAEFVRATGPERVRVEALAGVDVEGLAAYESATAGGRGAIVVTAHLGNWDLAACSQAFAGRRLTLLSRRLSNRGLDRYWMERRRAAGLEIVEERTPFVRLAELVRSGRTLVLIVDQATPPEQGGVRIPFLGRDAWTTRLPAMLAVRTGAPIFPVFVHSPAGARHRIRIEPPLAPDAASGRPLDRVLGLTRAINERLERRVLEHPDQWLWLHRRWKEFPRAPQDRR